MADTNTKDPFTILEHKIVRVLLIIQLVISSIKLLVLEVLSFTH